MALRIRLRRMGRKKAPHYRIVVAEALTPRDGRFVARVGHYNPRTEPMTLVVDREVARLWLSRGAKPTETVHALFKRAGVYSEPTVAESAVAAVRGAVGTVAEAASAAADTVVDAASTAASAVAGAAADAAERVREAAADVAERVTGEAGEAEGAGEAGEAEVAGEEAAPEEETPPQA